MQLLAHFSMNEIPSGLLLFMLGVMAGSFLTWSVREVARKTSHRK